MPIFQSSSFEYAGEANYRDVRYLRLNNTPNHIALHHKVASLEVVHFDGRHWEEAIAAAATQ
jgi:hypothetical protein